MTDTRLIYSTWPNPETAEAVASAVVEAGLAACANILPQATSIFVWEGKAQKEAETIMILKTSAATAPALTAALIARHPYDEPAVVALIIDVHGSSAPFLQWVAASTPGAA